MKRLVSLVGIFAAGLGAQSLEFFQAAPQVVPHRVLAGVTYLGVSLAEIDSKRAAELKLKDPVGVEITRVEEGSPADKAGLKSGDVVIEYNGEHVEGMEQFGRLVRETPAGREVKLVVSRNGANQSIAATLGMRKLRPLGGNFGPGLEIPEIHMPDMPQIFTTLHNPLLGVEAESLGSQLAAYFGVKQGVLVRSVLKDTAAEKAGMKAGDVITNVDGSAVSTPSELSSSVRSASSKKTFPVEVMRDHKELSVNVTIEDGRPERAIAPGRVVRNGVR
jgi:serine protease Do